MQLFILAVLTLIFDVLTDNIFICMFANCRHKIAVSPKLTTPQLFFYRWNCRKYFSCYDALNFRYYFSRTIRRNRLDYKMHMIPFCTNFQKSNFISLGNFDTNVFNNCVHFICDNKTSILCNTNKMTHQYRDVLAFTNQVSHEPIRNSILTTPQAAGY